MRGRVRAGVRARARITVAVTVRVWVRVRVRVSGDHHARVGLGHRIPQLRLCVQAAV